MKKFSHLREKFTGILLQPALLALPFAIVIVLFIPEMNKFKVVPVSQVSFTNDYSIIYDDMDNDGYSDHYFFGYFKGKAFVTVFSHFEVLDQWNFNGYYLQDGIRTITGDFDGDGKKEIFSFNYRNDSLFITGISYPEIKEFPAGGKFITVLPNAKGQGYTIHSAFLCDLNNDNRKEVVFEISAGYELKPRQVIAWDISHNSLLFSPDLGTGVTKVIPFFENGLPYFAVSCYASTNYKDSIRALHDNSVYFMILDKDLDFKFWPIEYKGGHRASSMQPIKAGNSTNLLFMHSGDKSDPIYRLRVCDTEGKTLHVREYPQESTDYFALKVLNTDEGDRILLVNYDWADLLDEKLELRATFKGVLLDVVHDDCDIDNDGNPEIIFYTGKHGEYLICRHDLSHPIPLSIGVPGKIKRVNTLLRGKQPPYFTVHADNMNYTFLYSANKWYALRYAVWGGVYIIIFGFIMLIRRMQRIQLRRKYQMKHRMTELKLESIRNQMDPHFTFNVLNAIGSTMLQNKPDESYSMLMKYSRLLRGTINASDKIWRTLEEEITFVKNYLELQKMRYGDVLKYEVNVGDDVDLHSKVPKMVIQTYTENAIRHGILPKENGGKVSVDVFMERNALVIEVTDDGVGRKRAAELHTTNTGKGLEIMRECYRLINELNELPIKEEITDLCYEDMPSGTRVRVEIPVTIAVN